ncbi:MAG: transposase [Desulfovibrio sp.]|jgi:transposase|nr:transposase [Desulfovibrio sp.]
MKNHVHEFHLSRLGPPGLRVCSPEIRSGDCFFRAPERNEAARLQEALKINEPLATAYYMKEDLRQFWSQKNKETAQIVVSSRIERAQTSGIAHLIRIGNTLAALKFGILNWYDQPISSGPMEGTNNKIKVLKRMASGYRDIEFFKLRILAIHEAKYALTG